MKYLVSFFLLISFVSCQKVNKGGDSDGFDKKSMLTDWANHIIIPSFVEYQSQLNTLENQVETFVTTPNETNLVLLRNQWKEAYKSFQYVALYNFGPAEDIVTYSNTFPASISDIQGNIVSGTYNFTTISSIDQQGFPALDYLINGLGSSDALIVDYYVNHSYATDYRNYLKAIVSQLSSRADAVITDWQTNYKDVFIENDGSGVASSVNLVVNAYVKNLEKEIRVGKVGIPSGYYSSGAKYPEKIESYYLPEFSKELLQNSISASQDFFNGKYFGENTKGESLVTYLDFLSVKKGEDLLSLVINNQYEEIKSKITNINSSIAYQVSNDNSKMLSLFDEIQKNVVNTKLNMMSALSIFVDYVDSDGD